MRRRRPGCSVRPTPVGSGIVPCFSDGLFIIMRPIAPRAGANQETAFKTLRTISLLVSRHTCSRGLSEPRSSGSGSPRWFSPATPPSVAVRFWRRYIRNDPRPARRRPPLLPLASYLSPRCLVASVLCCLSSAPLRSRFGSVCARGFRCVGALALVIAMVAGTVGCAQPCRMRLAHGVPPAVGELVWWHVSFGDSVRPPIVGIEIPTGAAQADQWVLADRGVRCFRYRFGAVRSAGLPLATTATPSDLDQVRQWLRYYLPVAAPARVLPPTKIIEVSSMGQVVNLLEHCWPDARIAPPAHLPPYDLADEIEAFPHGVWQLRAATKNLGA